MSIFREKELDKDSAVLEEVKFSTAYLENNVRSPFCLCSTQLTSVLSGWRSGGARSCRD